MTRQVSIVAVYFADNRFMDVKLALENEFKTELNLVEYAGLGDAHACMVEVSVPDAFALHMAQQRLREALPTVRIKMMIRFRESWWGRYRWSIAIAIGGGIAVAVIVDLLRPLAARLREMLG